MVGGVGSVEAGMGDDGVCGGVGWVVGEEVLDGEGGGGWRVGDEMGR